MNKMLSAIFLLSISTASFAMDDSNPFTTDPIDQNISLILLKKEDTVSEPTSTDSTTRFATSEEQLNLEEPTIFETPTTKDTRNLSDQIIETTPLPQPVIQKIPLNDVVEKIVKTKSISGFFKENPALTLATICGITSGISFIESSRTNDNWKKNNNLEKLCLLNTCGFTGFALLHLLLQIKKRGIRMTNLHKNQLWFLSLGLGLTSAASLAGYSAVDNKESKDFYANTALVTTSALGLTVFADAVKHYR